MAFRIEHRIGVQAPAEVIWRVLSDLDGWSRWNPLYPKASGRIGLGEKLTLTVALPGEPQRPLAPRVIDWEPNAQIVWRIELAPLLGHAVRYIEIESLSETGCIVANGEFFHGALGEAYGKRKRRPIRDGFEALGEALKAEAERVWRAERIATTSDA